MSTKTRPALTRQTSWRDSFTPFTKEELKSYDVMFASLPSFKDNTISTADFQLGCDNLKWPRAPEVIKAYQRIWDKYHNGRIHIDQGKRLAEIFHNTAEFFHDILISVDLDNDGFISKDEYDILIEMIGLHAENWCGITHEDFVQEVDVNEDGKISIEDALNWVEKHAPKYND